MKYNGYDERWIPGFGVFRPGDIVDYNETLYSTGLFEVIEKQESAGE